MSKTETMPGTCYQYYYTQGDWFNLVLMNVNGTVGTFKNLEMDEPDFEKKLDDRFLAKLGPENWRKQIHKQDREIRQLMVDAYNKTFGTNRVFDGH
jgi:hypothetical protein